MKCTLMNKNNEVLVAEYNEALSVFTEIYEIKNIEYAPVILFNDYQKNINIASSLTDWFIGRGIPSLRDNLDILLARLNISSPKELLDKAFGLSLSDQYWVKPYESDISYADINFFEHDFEDIDFTKATFSDDFYFSTKISLISPNNTTDGRLKKTWIIDNGKRYLLKAGFKSEVMQPFNEVLASCVSNRLGINHVPYTLEVVNDRVLSKCICFINTDTELVSAHQILHNNSNKDNIYEEYINILEEKGIKDAREKLENMFILDFLILNEDRHLNNFGIIRDVNTLEWIDVAPIFDNGQSLNILDYNGDEVVINGLGRFFYNVDDFDSIINHIKNLKRIDISKLDGVVEEFEELLHSYQHITKMTDRRINKICTLLFCRIEKLKEIIKGR